MNFMDRGLVKTIAELIKAYCCNCISFFMNIAFKAQVLYTEDGKFFFFYFKI